MIVEGGILINACISMFASILAVYTIWYKIIPAVNGYVQSRKRMDTVLMKVDDSIPEIRKSLMDAMGKIDQAVEEFQIIQEGLMTVEGPEGPIVVPMAEQIRMAGESMLMSLGGAYLSEKPSKEEQAMHEIKLKGFAHMGMKLGQGLRRGAELDKYDPLIARFAGAGGAQAGGGGGELDIMSVAGSFVPPEFQGILGGLLGGGGGGGGNNGPSKPKQGGGGKMYGEA